MTKQLGRRLAEGTHAPNWPLSLNSGDLGLVRGVPARSAPALTHKSPISRTLLRYRWQSCSTCGHTKGFRTQDQVLTGRAPQDAAPWDSETHIGVPISEDLVQDVAELPAEDGAAGQREADSIGPEGEGALLMVCAENDACRVKGQGQVQARGWGR